MSTKTTNNYGFIFLNFQHPKLYTTPNQFSNVFYNINKLLGMVGQYGYVGFYEVRNEIILLKDVELIKRICVDAADHFIDHRSIVMKSGPLCHHLFSLKGQKWRDVRSNLNPAFDKNEINKMFPLVLDCTSNMISYLNLKLKDAEGTHEIEMKDFFSRYICDVIASCTFGRHENSLKDPENDFYIHGQTLSRVEILQFANIMTYSNLFLKMFDVKNSDEKAWSYLRNIIMKCLKERELSKSTGIDFLQYIADSKTISSLEVSNSELLNEDFITQALCLFIGGLAPLSNVLTFLFYEIVSNTNIQTKLQKEIDDVKNAKRSCEDIMSMKYLDMVVSEVLRKWPPLIATDRECTKPFTLSPANEKARTYIFLTKYAVWIPIYSIHHDKDHYPNPELFDPERFSEKNRALRKPFTFIPFGAGPRNCIGSNFSLLIVKTTVVHLLSKFNFVALSKTSPTLSVCNEGLYLKPKHDVWLGIKPRD